MRIVAVAFGCLVGCAGLVFTAGEALDDPGGAAGAGLVALVVLPAAALALAAWLDAGRALGLAVAAVVVGAVVLAAVPELERGRGPVRAVAVVVLLPALALLGRRHPAAAGRLLAALGAVSLAVVLVPRGHSAPLLALAVPVLVDAALFLAARPRGAT